MNEIDNNACTALILAAWNGHDSIVKLLLDAGAALWKKDNRQWTALDYARDWKHESTIKILLNADKGGPLLQAASKGDSDLVSTLLQDGEDVSRRSEDGETALHRAADGGHIEVVKILLKSGVDLGAQTYGRNATALYRAAYRGHCDVVEALLNAGAQVETKNLNKWMAFHSSAQYGHLGVMNLLLNPTKKFLGTDDSLHLSSTEHLENCATDPLNLLKCLVEIYPNDEFLQRGLANEYFKHEMFSEAKQSYDKFFRTAMRNAGVTKMDNVAHSGYNCDGCGKDLTGLAYKCMKCDWLYDACESCFLGHQHPVEDAIKIPSDDVYRDFLDMLGDYQLNSIEHVMEKTSGVSRRLQDTDKKANFIEMTGPRSEDASDSREHRHFPETTSDSGRENRWFEIAWLSPRTITDPKSCSSIRDALTITIETNNKEQRVSANLIGHYVEESWGWLGKTLLDVVLDLLAAVLGVESAHESSQLSSRSLSHGPSNFHLVANKDFLLIEGTGSNSEWTIMIECLIWLEQVIGLPEAGLTYRPWRAEFTKTPSLRASRENGKLTSHESPLTLGQIRGFTIHFGDEVRIDRQHPPIDRCWSQLIKSSYIGHRHVHEAIINEDYGMRIPFCIMIKLAAVEHMYQCDKGVILTGYDTALIPTRIMEDGSIVWHVLFDKNFSEGGILTSIETALEGGKIVPIHVSIPQSGAVGYLGWSEEVEVTLGSKQKPMRPHRTQLEFDNPKFRAMLRNFKANPGVNVTVPFGTLTFAGMGGQTFPEYGTLGYRSLSKNYILRYQQLFNETVVVYCTNKDRAWLVPKINVILYIIQIVAAEMPTAEQLDIKYPRKRSLRDACEEMRRLEMQVIIAKDKKHEDSSELLFRTLFDEYSEILQYALGRVKDCDDYSFIRAVELADIIDKVDVVPKRLPVTPGINCWRPLLGKHGIIICDGLDEALEACDTNNSCSLEAEELKGRISGVLSCLVCDLKTWIKGESASGQRNDFDTDCIEKSGYWRWKLTGTPYARHGQDRCNGSCWSGKLQQVESVAWRSQLQRITRGLGSSHQTVTPLPTFKLRDVNEHAGICFGSVALN